MITNLLALFLQVELEDNKAMLPAPINNRGYRNVMDPNEDFHAGHFLRDLLQEAGHDVAWLAARTDSDTEALESLLEQPNMDAELFVRLGMPMEPLFMRRVEEMIFGKDKTVA